MNTQELFKAFGRTVEMRNGNGRAVESCHAFIQPLRYKNKMYLDGINTEIGFNSQGHYLYIGPPSPDLTLAADDYCIFADGVSYQIDRAERVYKGEKVFYIWAIIRTIVEVN